jgi:hypothetical protein
MAELVRLSAEEIQALGLTLAGFTTRQAKTRQATSLDRFRSNYGLSPASYANILVDLQTTNQIDARVNKPDPRLLLMMGNWLKTYATKSQMVGPWQMDEKTIHKWIWHYAGKAQALKLDKVSWEHYFK